MKLENKVFKVLSIGLLSVLIYSGCKKYDNPPPVYEELKNLTTPQRKVLVISIDGLTGTELQTVAPTNIATLQKNSKYSYNTLKGASDAAGWASMLTGTGLAKHLITADNFERGRDPNGDDHASIVSYRNVLDYVTQYKAVKTAMVTSWANLRNYVRNADLAPVVSTDLAVKDSTINIINTQTSLGTMFVNFRDVQLAGNNGGFLASNANYKNAIIKADEYVGNILTALKARKNYANENWLIIITTNHGGSSTNPTNGFTIVYNPAFKPFELIKTGFNTVNFKTDAVFAAVPNDNGLYDMSDNKDFTVQMDVKMNQTGAYYPKILGKSNGLDATFTGWFWMQEGTQWNLEFGGVKNGGANKQQLGIPGALSTGWNTLTMTVKYVNATTRTASAYVNGVFKNSYNVSNVKSINTTEPLRLGGNYTTTSTTDFYAANLQIFNVALDAATITANKDLKDITKHPNYSNLIGFWPIDEGAENIIANKAPVGYNMSLSGGFSWSALGTNFPPGTTATNTTSNISVVSTAGDVAALTLYWMNINILADFGFDGKAYLKNFELEFLK